MKDCTLDRGIFEIQWNLVSGRISEKWHTIDGEETELKADVTEGGYYE